MWGPTSNSISWVKWFVSFINDCTHVKWIFLIKHKSKVCQIFVDFFYLVKNQFNKSIKRLRSDNGTEFVNLEFSKFLKHNGVVHELTCVNIPQQNGVVERKICHLLEVARALLFQMYIPNWESYLEVKFVIESLPFLTQDAMESLPFPTQDVQVQVQEVTKFTLILEHVQLFELEVSIHENPIEDVTDDMSIALRKGKQSYEALKDENWVQAIKEEMKALEKNSTWEIDDRLKDKRLIYTVKCKSYGTLQRYKARLVAKGYTHTYGIDYDETFAHIANMNTIRVIFSLATHFGWNLQQFDVKNVFLHGDLKKEV
ncbi:Copia protein, partial [Mucuna pruriens]